MARRYSEFYDLFVNLIDSIVHDADPVDRLMALRLITRDGHRILIQERNRAAYDLRVKMTADEAARVSGIPRKHLNSWAARHPGPEKLKRKNRSSIPVGVNMSEDAGFPSPYPSNKED